MGWNSQWSMVNGQWSMVNGQWSMVNGQWSKKLANQVTKKYRRSATVKRPPPCASRTSKKLLTAY